ncbi:hypothetical protein HMJ29_12450 [Hymenobacter taeanensis]|uniref:Uncharacterized protein n=1 Tax=Hymenobacter taeanensis TaxID=2735321 RepID=A0A6M6BHQ2_9BACT|nr:MULTISPECIES: hypothetical protein [Hymenobacter]QJX47707.1 hypothetical protein HMJ29_12450 [Hymenobacter taeanensis]UOQ82808.1 hypothetical protein MUN83_08620 [Hymenobacter sp. 5414T-23]
MLKSGTLIILLIGSSYSVAHAQPNWALGSGARKDSPTLEARYYATYFDTTGSIKRTIKAEILELQLAWSL